MTFRAGTRRLNHWPTAGSGAETQHALALVHLAWSPAKMARAPCFIARASLPALNSPCPLVSRGARSGDGSAGAFSLRMSGLLWMLDFPLHFLRFVGSLLEQDHFARRILFPPDLVVGNGKLIVPRGVSRLQPYFGFQWRDGFRIAVRGIQRKTETQKSIGKIRIQFGSAGEMLDGVFPLLRPARQFAQHVFRSRVLRIDLQFGLK